MPVDPEQRRGEIARRYRWHGRQNRPSLASLRVAELNRLFFFRYGATLPEDDSGRDDIEVMAHHLAHLPGNAARRIRSWITDRAPWFSNPEQTIAAVLARPQRWKADRLGKRLGLTMTDRKALGITTIGAIDTTLEQRRAARRDRNRKAKATARRTAGAVPRAEYEANSITRTEPWFALGISRRTWYRRRVTQQPTQA